MFFPFMTIFNWGESPLGKWKLIIEARTRTGAKENQGKIDHFAMNFYGFKNTNEIGLKKRLTETNRAFVPSSNELVKIYKRELKSSRQSQIIHKKLFESNPELKKTIKKSISQSELYSC